MQRAKINLGNPTPAFEAGSVHISFLKLMKTGWPKSLDYLTNPCSDIKQERYRWAEKTDSVYFLWIVFLAKDEMVEQTLQFDYTYLYQYFSCYNGNSPPLTQKMIKQTTGIVY
jgi:hypothetical protein